jgi:hypothetical protein
MYVMNCIRPNITCSINKLCKVKGKYRKSVNQKFIERAYV